MSLRLSKSLDQWIHLQLEQRGNLPEKRLLLILDVLAAFSRDKSEQTPNKSSHSVWRPSQLLRRRLAKSREEALRELENEYPPTG